MGISEKGRIEFTIHATQMTRLVIDTPQTEGYVIGRSDSKSNYIPDIDLVGFDGLEKGVSRRHAALVHTKDSISVIDLGAVNGTFLNDSRLEPHKPYALSSGDRLRLGTLLLTFQELI